MTEQTTPTLFEVFDDFINNQLHIESAEPLDWRDSDCDSQTEAIGCWETTGAIPIWIHFHYKQTRQNLGNIERKAAISFTTTQVECERKSQDNIIGFCAVHGRESNAGPKRKFEFSFLSTTYHGGIPLSNPTIILAYGRILTLFHQTWQRFKLERFV